MFVAKLGEDIGRKLQFIVREIRGISTIERFYPLDDTFVMTQPSLGLARSRIDHFADRIRHGDVPIVFCTRTHSSYAPFVVDGHHKLVAYLECKVPPRVLEIIRQESSPISETAERTFFPDSAGRRQLLEARKQTRGAVIGFDDESEFGTNVARVGVAGFAIFREATHDDRFDARIDVGVVERRRLRLLGENASKDVFGATLVGVPASADLFVASRKSALRRLALLAHSPLHGLLA